MSSYIYESENYRIRQVLSFDTDIAVVTFAPWSKAQRLDADAFGEAYLRSLRLNSFHVSCAHNDWYQREDVVNAVTALRSFMNGRYKFRIGYGSSMGAFAAIALSKLLDLNAVLAISPQFSIVRESVPFESRWASESADINWLYSIENGISKDANICVLYDPFHLDARHVALIRKCRGIAEMKLPFSGHPSGDFLKEAGLISYVVKNLLFGAKAPQDFRREVRSMRQKSSIYWSNMSRALQAKKKMQGAYNAITRASELSSGKIEYFHLRGHAAIRIKNYPVAIDSFRIVVQAWSERAKCHYNLSYALMMGGYFNDALTSARRANELDAGVSQYVEQVQKLERILGA